MSPDVYSKSPYFYFDLVCLVSSVSLSFPAYKPHEAASVCRLHGTHMLRDRDREVNERSVRRLESFVRVCTKLFWHAIYCANHRLEPDTQSISMSHRGLVRQTLTDHTWVWFRHRDCDPTANTSTYVQNGFFHFTCHELTQIHKYDQGLLYKHAINRNNKQRFFLVARGNDFRDFPYFVFPTNPGEVLLAPSFRCHSPSAPVWYQYDFIIIPRWGRLLLSLNSPYRDW